MKDIKALAVSFLICAIGAWVGWFVEHYCINVMPSTYWLMGGVTGAISTGVSILIMESK